MIQESSLLYRISAFRYLLWLVRTGRQLFCRRHKGLLTDEASHRRPPNIRTASHRSQRETFIRSRAGVALALVSFFA